MDEGKQLTFQMIGEGNEKKILALHPMFWSAEQTLALFKDLSDEYCIIAPDLASHGTRMDEEFTTPKIESDRIAEGLKKEGLDHFEMAVGFSLGGRVLLELIRHPELSFKHIYFDCAPVYKKAGIISSLQEKMFLNKWRKAKKKPSVAVEKMSHLYGQVSSVMGDTLDHMSEHSLENIILHSLQFDFPEYPEEVEKSMTFDFGELDYDSKQIPKIKKHYPKAKVIMHKGFGSCEFALKENEYYIKHLKQILKNG